MAWPGRPRMPDSTAYRDPEVEALFDEAFRWDPESAELARLWKRYESNGKLKDADLDALHRVIAEAPVRCPDCGEAAPPGTSSADNLCPRCRYYSSPEANIPPRGAL